jgi:hypothetical protein
LTSFSNHAQELVKQYQSKRRDVLYRRQKFVANDEINKQKNYQVGLKHITNWLIKSLEEYKNVFELSLPELRSNIHIKSGYPEDLRAFFSLNKYTLKFVTRISRKGEEFQESLVDGVLYCESSYNGAAQILESQFGLWSQEGITVWGFYEENGEFKYLDDTLPALIELLFNKATFELAHRFEKFEDKY